MQESVMTNPEAYARWLLERRLAPEQGALLRSVVLKDSYACDQPGRRNPGTIRLGPSWRIWEMVGP
jgi:hypothetical protein